MSNGGISITLFGLVRIDLPPITAESIRRRFTDRTIFGGPCLLIDRRWGLALDATTDPRHGTRPVLWTPHAAPWQQWRIKRARGETVRIVSEHGGMVLTTDAAPKTGDGSWVWLENDQRRDSQQWKIKPTDDRVAFLVQANQSEYALDARTDTKVPAVEPHGSVDDPTPPILWSTHREPWQQWLIVRLPLD
ncbi:RICIN domain-containing protein [Dactylosporangium sp. NPDC048998]|uniref:RICIN domain-containing protein n=1 Tax=Dactylosporangium sp. NPDC048998 TaxID=3363976 RepID=UPI00371E156D